MQIIGINGVMLSTIFCTVVISIPWGTYILFKNYFKISPKEYYKRIFIYVFVTVLISFATLIICDLLPSSGWLVLIAKCGICLVIPNILFWIAFRKAKEYSYVVVLWNRVSKKILARQAN